VTETTRVGTLRAVSRRFVASVCAVAGATIAVAACGASQAIDPVSRAAAVTLSTPGYRMSAVMSVSSPTAPVTASMTGQIDTAADRGTMTMNEVVGGRPVKAAMVFSKLNFYMRSAAIPGASKLTGGKPWIYVDMGQALGAMGVGSLPGTTDPSQFLDYMSAVGATPTRVASVSIHGVKTTEYRAVIDLDRYAKKGYASAKTVSTLESALGSHTLPIEAWIDGQNRVRRIHMAFPECVDGNKVRFNMTMGIYDFGSQPQGQIPTASQVYNLTPVLAAEYGKVKLSCKSAS
jgi:hypothetical protein